MEFAPDSDTLDVFNNVFAFFGTLSTKGSVQSLRGRVFEKIDIDPELLIGQKFSETVYWQSSEYISKQVENSISQAAEGSRERILVNFRVGAGEIINVELYLHPIFENEEVKQIFFCAQEVTAREKEIEFYKERSEYLLYAAENAEVGLWYWDLAKDLKYSTPKCNELFDISANDVITLDSFLKIVHPEDRPEVEAALTESRTHGREYNKEFRVVYANDNVDWIGARGKTYLDDEGNPKIMMGVVRKVTDKKLANEELSKIYDREKKARDEAEEANRAKDFFLAVVSHELRSPLNAILGWSKILLTKEVDDETRKSALETIEKSARTQAKLIDDLIDSARISSGKLKLEMQSLNLFEVIKTVYNSQQPAAEAKNINLEFSTNAENIQVYGDSFRLQQIFSNILSNAMKFTGEGGNIKIDAQTDSNSVKISVEDNGQGISANALPDIFRQFRQDDERKTLDRSGLGLGLSIVKILVEKHTGKIKAESAGAGQGATFTVVLPLCGTQTDSPAEIEKSDLNGDAQLKGIKVLIIEDDPDSREVLHLLLEQSGAEVTGIDSAREAINFLRNSNGNLPDVIISDLAMPNEDGYSLIERVRKLTAETGGEIPALALSAFASNDNKDKAYNAGFQKYHTKPFEPDVIVQDILQIVKK